MPPSRSRATYPSTAYPFPLGTPLVTQAAVGVTAPRMVKGKTPLGDARSGEAGVAAQHAAQVGKSASEAAREAERIGTLIGAGRLIAAPSGLSAELFQCLVRAIARIRNDQAFHDRARAANRSLDLTEASEALAEIRAATEYGPALRRHRRSRHRAGPPVRARVRRSVLQPSGGPLRDRCLSFPEPLQLACFLTAHGLGAWHPPRLVSD